MKNQTVKNTLINNNYSNKLLEIFKRPGKVVVILIGS